MREAIEIIRDMVFTLLLVALVAFLVVVMLPALLIAATFCALWLAYIWLLDVRDRMLGNPP